MKRFFSLILIVAMVAQGAVDAKTVSALNIANATATSTDNAARAMAYRRLFEERLAPELGGKGAWDTILEELAPKIGYRTAPGSLRLAIKDVWYDFLAANAAAVERGNALIERDLAATGQVSLETRNALSATCQSFTFPPELVARIEARAVLLAGHIIARSSGRREDSYERNLAGILTSEARDDRRAAVQAVREVFRDAVRRFWIYQNEEDEGTIEGLPRILTPDEGLGLVIQSFLQFDAAGTAMSDLYRHVSVEAVVGDAATAVRPVHANVCGFLVPRDRRAPLKVPYGYASITIEFNPAYLDSPHSFCLRGVEYSADTDPERIREVLAQYPRIHGVISPVDEAQAREVVRVSLALEEEIGVPLDIEWGFLDDELYIVQMRPIIGDFSKPLVEPSVALAEAEPAVRTPIALGQTPSGGITSRAVYVARGTNARVVAAFERDYDTPYIRIQYDAISAILGRKTRATVLVDPWQGSRQAHNVNVVSGRLAAGEFVYANGPVLRKGLAEALDFQAVPGHPGIFMSQQEVTYFADGLRGAFYIEGQGASPKGEASHGVKGQGKESVFEVMDREAPKTESVASFQLPDSGKEEGPEIAVDPELVAKFREEIGKALPAADASQIPSPRVLACAMVDSVAIKGYSPSQGQIIRIVADNERHSASELKRCIGDGLFTREDIDALVPAVAALAEALADPSLPATEGSAYLTTLHNICWLTTGSAELVADSARPAQERMVTGDDGRFRLLVIEDDPREVREMEGAFSKYLDPADYEVTCVRTSAAALRELEKGSFDAISFDTNIDDAHSLWPALLAHDHVILRSGSFYEVDDLVASGAVKINSVAKLDETMIPLLKSWREEKLKAIDAGREESVHSPQSIGHSSESVEEGPSPKGEASHGAGAQGLGKAGDVAVPKTRVLMIEDAKIYAKTLQAMLCMECGDEYDISIVATNAEALAYLQDTLPDVAIVDVQFEGMIDHRVLAALTNVPHIIVSSGDSEEVVKKEIADQCYSAINDRAIVLEKKGPRDDLGKIIPEIKRARDDQLKAIEAVREEKAVAGSQSPVGSTNDEAVARPERLRVLFVEEEKNEREIFEEVWKRDIDESEYELTSVLSNVAAREALESGAFDLVVCNDQMAGRDQALAEAILEAPYFALNTGMRFNDELGVDGLFASRAAFLYGPGKTDLLRPYLRRVRLEQVAEWEGSQKPLTEEPREPGKTRVLMIDDDRIGRSNFEDSCEMQLGGDDYEWVGVGFNDDATDPSVVETYDVVVCDVAGLDIGYVKAVIDATKNAILRTALDEKEVLHKLGDEYFARVEYIDKVTESYGYIPLIKRARERALKSYHRARERWDASVASSQSSVGSQDGGAAEGPEWTDFPEDKSSLKTRILWLEDDSDIARSALEAWRRDLPADEYEFVWASSVDDALGHLNKPGERFDLVMSDLYIKRRAAPHFIRQALAVSRVAVVSAAQNDEALRMLGQEVMEQVEYFTVADIFSAGIPYFKRVREERLKALDAAREAEITPPREADSDGAGQASAPEGPRNDDVGRETRDARRATILVLDNSGADGGQLARFLRGHYGEGCAAKKCATMYQLSLALEKTVPDVVVTNTMLMADGRPGDEGLDTILETVREHNPFAKIIIASEEAAYLSFDEYKDRGVIGIVEKPFHFGDVVDVLEGTYDAKRVAAKLMALNDEASRLFRDAQPALPMETKREVLVWEGYTTSGDVRTRIEKNTRGRACGVTFHGLEELIDEICARGGSDDAVAILPARLTKRMHLIARLAESGARVIFVDIDTKDAADALGTDDVLPLDAIILSGVAYLDNNSRLFMRLYRLITGDKDHKDVLVEDLRDDPTLLSILITPATIHNYELRRKVHEHLSEPSFMA